MHFKMPSHAKVFANPDVSCYNNNIIINHTLSLVLLVVLPTSALSGVFFSFVVIHTLRDSAGSLDVIIQTVKTIFYPLELIAQ